MILLKTFQVICTDFLGLLVYSGLAVVGELGSDDAHLYRLLLLMVLSFWLSPVFVGLGDSVWCLPLLSLSCFRYSGTTEALVVANLLWGLPIVEEGLQKGREAADCPGFSRSPW
jgi:hypothetical protein